MKDITNLIRKKIAVCKIPLRFKKLFLVLLHLTTQLCVEVSFCRVLLNTSNILLYVHKMCPSHCLTTVCISLKSLLSLRLAMLTYSIPRFIIFTLNRSHQSKGKVTSAGLSLYK